MRYYLIIREMSNPFSYRLRMVEYALTHSISAASKEYKTTRKTVRKWAGRYKNDGLDGLKDKSKAPRRIPHKMQKEPIPGT